MHWLAVVVLVVACQRPVAEPVEPERITPAAAVTPPPDAPPLPSGAIRARILAIEIEGGDQIVKLAAGSDQGVSTEWTACLLRASSDECHPAGTLEIVRVEPRWIKARLTATDVVTGNANAKLAPPP